VGVQDTHGDTHLLNSLAADVDARTLLASFLHIDFHSTFRIRLPTADINIHSPPWPNPCHSPTSPFTLPGHGQHQLRGRRFFRRWTPTRGLPQPDYLGLQSPFCDRKYWQILRFELIKLFTIENEIAGNSLSDFKLLFTIWSLDERSFR